MPDFFRIVRSQTPSVADFTSNASAGLALRPPDTPEKTLRDPAHYTMWGEPAMLLALVESVSPLAVTFD